MYTTGSHSSFSNKSDSFSRILKQLFFYEFAFILCFRIWRVWQFSVPPYTIPFLDHKMFLVLFYHTIGLTRWWNLFIFFQQVLNDNSKRLQCWVTNYKINMWNMLRADDHFSLNVCQFIKCVDKFINKREQFASLGFKQIN